MSDFEEETIERCAHDAENPYAQISRSLIRDKSISPECRWLIIYLLSNTDNWVIKTKQIYNHVKEHMGRDRVLAAINEAVAAGYMKRETFIKNNLKRHKYYVSEFPKFKKCFRCPESQGTETQAPENQGTPKKDPSSSYEDKDKHIQEREEASPPPSPVHKYFNKVKIEEKKYQELIQEFGDEAVKKKIERLDAYGDENPKRFKRYGCHAAIVRRWLKEDKTKVIDNEVAIDEEEHRKIAQQVVHNFPVYAEKKAIQIQNNGISFHYGHTQELIHFSDIEFRDKLTCHLAFISTQEVYGKRRDRKNFP